LTTAHPHVWQEQAALALAVPRLLAAGSPPPAAAALADGLLEEALATLRTDEPRWCVCAR
jgi:hypothetical protein